MRSRTASTGAALLTALATVAVAAPQTPAEPSAPVVRIGAVVTVDGAPVAGLTAADFTLTEDGVERPIETAAPRTGPRVFAFLLDEFHVTAGPPADAVREALARFVRDVLRPGDRLAVLKPMDPLTRIRFTEDRDEALAAIADFDGRRDDLTPRSAAEERLLGSSPALVRAARLRVVSSALRALTTEVGRMETRGVVVLVSEGFSEPNRGVRRRLPDLPMLLRVATALDVPVYGFAPLDAQTQASGAAGEERESEDDEPRGTLGTLAERTGGRASFGRDRMDADLARMAADVDASYQLTFWASEPFDGTYHQVEVRVTRPDAEVWTRPGYWAPLGDRAVRPRVGPAPSLPLMSWRSRPVHRSPFAEVWVGLSRGSGDRMRVVVTWEPDWGPAWSRGDDRAAVGRFKAQRPDGTLVFEGRIAPAFGGPVEAPRAAIFEATPGPLELDLTLVDEDGRVLDVDSRDVAVPEPDEARVRLMDPELVRARTAVEFRELAADPDAPPTPSRTFRRTEQIIVRAPAYDADGAPLPVRARLLNPLGQVMLELEPMAAPARDGVTQFALSLAPYAPGAYEIELAATGAAGEVRTRVRFELTG